MMTDNIVASLPLDELRSIMRSLLTIHPSVTPVFEEQTRNYLDETTSKYSKIANAASTHRGSLCTYRTAYAEWLGVDYATRLCRYCASLLSEFGLSTLLEQMNSGMRLLLWMGISCRL
jgi:hypothetical protein